MGHSGVQETRARAVNRRPSIVVGVTHPQTCLVLKGRLTALREAGFDVTVISSPGPLLLRTGIEEGVTVLPIPLERGIAPVRDIAALFRLWKALRALRPDVTEFSTPKAGMLGAIAGWLAGVPARVYLLRGLKLETSMGWKRSILLAAERIAAACSHLVVCNSESLRSKALKLGIADESKLWLLGDGSSKGVDVDRFSAGSTDVRAKHGIPLFVPLVGYVGRLTKDKGIPELIKGFELVLDVLPSARLLLVGWFDESEDALSKELRELICIHPRIVCTGFTSDTAPYYRAMDVMVLPTWREGFPNVALEAAASGVPVITTLSTGSRDAVVPEVTGLLVPPGYPEAISEAVLSLLRDPNRCYTMGRAARRWVIRNFTDARVLGLTVDLYKTLVSQQVEGHRVPGATDAVVAGD